MKAPSELARMVADQREFFRGRYAYLLMALLAMLVATPLLTVFENDRFWGGVVFSGVLVFATSAIAGSRSMLIIGVSLAVPAVLLNMISIRATHLWVVVLTHVAIIAFLTWTGLALLSSVLRGRQVSVETINGSLCVYLLMGVGGAFVYSLLESVHPGAFAFPPDGETFDAHHHGRGYARMLYFSFVTLTTVGYGDITPRLPLARSLATLHGVTGQFYLTVLVARLVGLHIAHSVGMRAGGEARG